MKTATNRKLTAVATSAAIVLGAVGLAPSVAANFPTERLEFSGYKDCHNGETVAAEGKRTIDGGTFWIYVPGAVLNLGNGETSGFLQSSHPSGSWEVGGSAAYAGNGFCLWF